MKIKIGSALLVVVLAGWWWHQRSRSPEQRAHKIIQQAKKEARKRNREKPVTAKEAAKLAESVGKHWAGDAYLLSVETFGDTERKDGKANHWAIEFFSVGKNMVGEVDVIGGEANQRVDEKNPFHPQKLPTDWLDSPKIMKVALTKCPAKTVSYWLGLRNKKWVVKCRQKEAEPFWVDIDASSGQILSTRTGY